MTERAEGRKADELRPLDLQPDFLEQPHGCVLYAQGNTVVLCTATLEEEIPRWLRGKGRGWMTAEYSLLPASTGERTQRAVSRGRPDGRTVETQRLIGTVTDGDVRRGILRGVLGFGFLSRSRAGLEAARVLSLSHEHFRWCVSIRFHLHHSHRVCCFLSLAAFSSTRRCLSIGLLLSHCRNRTLCHHLLDLDKRRQLLHRYRFINGFKNASASH